MQERQDQKQHEIWSFLKTYSEKSSKFMKEITSNRRNAQTTGKDSFYQNVISLETRCFDEFIARVLWVNKLDRSYERELGYTLNPLELSGRGDDYRTAVNYIDLISLFNESSLNLPFFKHYIFELEFYKFTDTLEWYDHKIYNTLISIAKEIMYVLNCVVYLHLDLGYNMDQLIQLIEIFNKKKLPRNEVDFDRNMNAMLNLWKFLFFMYSNMKHSPVQL